jgi:hypothetical protein
VVRQLLWTELALLKRRVVRWQLFELANAVNRSPEAEFGPVLAAQAIDRLYSGAVSAHSPFDDRNLPVYWFIGSGMRFQAQPGVLAINTSQSMRIVPYCRFIPCPE